MIPIKLKLRNFMAYRQTELDFQGIHLAVLTGDNGAGKSSLLDAITWALWGKARAKRDDELIHLGQSEMETEYTFSLNDNVYRVIRKRDASGRGRSDLSFHVQEAGGWRTLTDTTLRATQRKIIQQLSLDYDTFINSSFLLQGRADEFTTKPPGQRKEILSDILGLRIYEFYQEQAKKRANEQEKMVAAIVAKIEQIEQELANEPVYRAELAEAEKEVATLNQQLQAAEKEMEVLREQHRAINEKQRQLDDLRNRLADAQTDITELAEAITAAQTNIAQYRTILERRVEIEAGLEQLRSAQERVKDWGQRLQESARLSKRKHELDRAVDAARAKVEADLREIETTIDLLSPKVASLDTQHSQMAEVKAELETLQAVQTEQERRRETLIALGEEAVRLKEQNRQLKSEMNDIKANLTQLQQAVSTCPVCQRPLDDAHRSQILGQIEREGKAKGDNYRTNQVRLEEIIAEQKGCQQNVVEADRQLRSLAAVQGRLAQLTQSLAEAETAANQLSQVQIRQADLQKQLDNQEFAAEVIAELDEVKAELTSLGYDETAHQKARAEVEALLHIEEEGRALNEAERRIIEEEERLAKEGARHERLLKQTAADRDRIAVLEEETAGLPELSTRLNQASDEVNRLQREERFARDKVAAARQKLKYVADQAKKRGEEENKLQQIRESLSIYRELQLAFGKNGIQAMLIDSAIPEIEDEANRLLSRMTDNRMQVRFETQREAKSGDNTIETLDIRIADEVGTRDYELYSGGEAFRVNFAIRVAMSKVLARRAGARLQTLVIDEGFGTQDVQGRERLVEAINIIQEDFEKIIVITHIDELKDVFPVRIDIWKTGEGSQVAIH